MESTQQEFRHFTPREVAMESKGKSFGTARQEAGCMGVFIVQQGNAVENEPKQGGKGETLRKQGQMFRQDLKEGNGIRDGR